MKNKIEYTVGACRVEPIEYFRRTWEDIATEVAAVSRNKTESKNKEVRFKSLMKEAALGTPSRAFEFLPTMLKATIFKGYVSLEPVRFEEIRDYPKSVNIDLNVFLTKIARFSYLEMGKNQQEYIVYTNARTLLKAGYKYEDIPTIPCSAVYDYKAVRVTCPYFVWAQLMTHTALSKISQSDRVTSTDEYWLPEDILQRMVSEGDVYYPIRKNEKFMEIFEERYNGKRVMDVKNALLHVLLNDLSQNEVQEFFKSLGYKREIYSRAIYYFKMKTFVIGGWDTDPHTWDNLFLERGVFPDRWNKTWVQQETKEVAEAIYKAISL